MDPNVQFAQVQAKDGGAVARVLVPGLESDGGAYAGAGGRGRERAGQGREDGAGARGGGRALGVRAVGEEAGVACARMELSALIHAAREGPAIVMGAAPVAAPGQRAHKGPWEVGADFAAPWWRRHHGQPAVGAPGVGGR